MWLTNLPHSCGGKFWQMSNSDEMNRLKQARFRCSKCGYTYTRGLRKAGAINKKTRTEIRIRLATYVGKI